MVLSRLKWSSGSLSTISFQVISSISFANGYISQNWQESFPWRGFLENQFWHTPSQPCNVTWPLPPDLVRKSSNGRWSKWSWNRRKGEFLEHTGLLCYDRRYTTCYYTTFATDLCFLASCPRCVHFSGRFKRFNVAGAASLAVATLCSYVRPRWPCRPGLAIFGPLALERYAVFSARQPFVHYNKETSFYKNDKLPCKCRSLRGCMVFALVDSAMTGKEWNLNIVDDQLGQLGPFESISITRFL